MKVLRLLVVGALLASLVLLAHALYELGNMDASTTMQVPSTEASPAPKVALAERTKIITHIVLDVERTVQLLGEVGPSAEDIAKKITKLATASDKPIYFVINSPGGSVLDGAILVSAIESSRAPVIVICHSLCASMAAIIFEYAHDRYMTDRSFVMFHPASGGAEGEIDKMASRLGSIQRFIGKFDSYIAARANVPYNKFHSLTQNELWLDSEDAVNSGFADKIVSVDLSVLPPPEPAFNLFSLPTPKRVIARPEFQWNF